METRKKLVAQKTIKASLLEYPLPEISKEDKELIKRLWDMPRQEIKLSSFYITRSENKHTYWSLRWRHNNRRIVGGWLYDPIGRFGKIAREIIKTLNGKELDYTNPDNCALYFYHLKRCRVDTTNFVVAFIEVE